MILRLFLFIVFYGGLLVVPGAGLGYIGWKTLKPVLERRRKRIQGMKNALMLESHTEELCFVCMRETDDTDCYEQGRGWYHHDCLTSLLG
jgi:hypothetical protein